RRACSPHRPHIPPACRRSHRSVPQSRSRKTGRACAACDTRSRMRSTQIDLDVLTSLVRTAPRYTPRMSSIVLRKLLVASLLATAGLASACVVRGQARVTGTTTAVVYQEPPQPRAETPGVNAGHVWI